MVLRLAVCRAQRDRLEHDGEPEDRDGDDEVLRLVRMAHLLDALEQGEQAAHAEQDQGDDECPEVALAAVPEGMLAVGGPLGAAPTEQQKALVAGIGNGVDALGEQACGAGDEEADELGEGDAGVCQQRGDDRFLLPSVTAT